MPSDPGSRSAFSCGACSAGIGVPRRVTTKGPHAVVLHVDCQACGHQWTITRTLTNGVGIFESSDAEN